MGNPVVLKMAEITDARFLWRLRNNKNIRGTFFDSSIIPYSKHLSWFKDKLVSSDACIFIVRNLEDRRVGYVRFEKEKDSIWKISIAITPKFQRKGHGSYAIIIGCRRLFKKLGAKKIVAYMRKDNVASLNTFQKVGFIFKKHMKFNGKQAALLELGNNVK